SEDLPEPSAVVPRIEAQDAHGAAVRAAQARDGLHRGGLAGAVAAQHAVDLSGLDAQTDVVDGDRVAVALAQAAHFDGGHGISFVRVPLSTVWGRWGPARVREVTDRTHDFRHGCGVP